jgi:flagellar basal-body rod protein FlgG
MEIADEDMPQKSSEGLFFSEKGTVSKNPQIQVGHIEESNVNSIGEMVKMLQGMRNYESTQKLIQSLDRMTEVTIQDVGRVL